MLDDSPETKRLKELVCEDFVASDNFHGTRIARGDYLIGTRIASWGVTGVILGILIDPLMRLRDQVRMLYTRLVVGFRTRPTLLAVYRVNNSCMTSQFGMIYCLTCAANSHRATLFLGNDT